MNLKYLKLIFVFAIIILTGAGAYFIINNKTQHMEDYHLHAGFVVFKDNKQVDFSDPKYMFIKPCTIGEEYEEEEDEQIEKAHLHNQIGDVVHVEREGSIWKDLFTNLEYDINYPETAAYLNGQKVENFQELPIKAYDSIVILVDSDREEEHVLKAVSREQILKAEARSENCG